MAGNESSQHNTEQEMDTCDVRAKKRKIEITPNLSDDQEEVLDTSTLCDNSREDINIEEKNEILLNDYIEHQSVMNMDAKTKAALKDKSKSKAPSTRKQMLGILQSEGLYRKFPSEKFDKFNEWLQSPSGGELQCTKEIVSEVNRFLHFCCPKTIKWKSLFDTKLFNNYLIITKKGGLGPDGVKTKVERILKALKYLQHRKPDLKTKCERTSTELKEWLRPLVKKKKVLRMQNSWRDELCGFRLTMEDVDTAVSPETTKRFVKIMEKAMANRKLKAEEYRVIVDTLITLTITQESAIRPGAFQYMTLQELENPLTYISTTDGTVYNIIFVLNHKTFSTHGPLAVPFAETVWIPLHNYLKYVRPQVEPKSPHQHLVFLNASGKMMRQPGKAITKATKHHEKKITATKVRHTIATVGSEKLTDVERRAVAKGIGHTMEVHDKVYTDLTIKAVKSSIEAQKKLHDKSKCSEISKKSS